MEWYAAKQDLIKIHNPGRPDDWSGLIWHNNVATVPKDSPLCGWKEELCQQGKSNNKLTVILLPTIGSLLVIVTIIIAFVLVKRYRYETNLKEIGEIKVSWNDIQLTDVTRNESVLSLKSHIHFDHIIAAHPNVKVAVYSEKEVVITLLGDTTLNIDERNILVDLKEIRELAHDNVNPFIGICTETPNVCFLMLYASRGSIQSIIADDNISLSRDFKVSFILDIACGMWYLHQSPVVAHGSLTSARCVVDNRWTCKITDHGIRYIKYKYGKYDQHLDNPARLLWTSPEKLQKERVDIHLSNETKKVDVFSFGIVASEIFIKDIPYGANDPLLEAKAIVQKVKKREKPPYRPTIPTDACNQKWTELIQKCWSEDPDQRPNFVDILYSINSIHRYKNLDLVDNMVKRLEQYTRTLEERVVQRSRELQEEKNKVEILLSELLPPSVAQQLAHGHQVAPEAFDNVTIFFSDIVGFTRISAASTPLQIVKFLNSMYSMFDDLAHNYDLYKVATIGDAYMVASGVPIRNGDKHAAEICALSLDLLDAIQDFPIEHIPDEHLSMRIGIFSGPCVAGVAGVKMPRYLLFGDTVDIAAKMESSGVAMRVHIGHTTEQLIRTDSDFKITIRGEMVIKGDMTVVTHWLERCIEL